MKINPLAEFKQEVLIQKTAQKGIEKIYKQKPFFFFLIAVVILFGGYKIYDVTKPQNVEFERSEPIEFVEYDDAGNPLLLPERIAKRDKEIDGIKNKKRKEGPCIQYAIRVKQEGFYPLCKGGTIFLRKNEIWKYGKTCLAKEERYPNFDDMLYDFIIETVGTEEECLIQEKLKIYNYALLPENLQRKVPIIRPPGNCQDN